MTRDVVEYVLRVARGGKASAYTDVPQVAFAKCSAQACDSARFVSRVGHAIR